MTNEAIPVRSEAEAVKLATVTFRRYVGEVIRVGSVWVAEGATAFRLEDPRGGWLRVRVKETSVDSQTLFSADDESLMTPEWRVEILNVARGYRFGWIDAPRFRIVDGLAPYTGEELELRAGLLSGGCPLDEVVKLIAAHRRGENIYAELDNE